MGCARLIWALASRSFRVHRLASPKLRKEYSSFLNDGRSSYFLGRESLRFSDIHRYKVPVCWNMAVRLLDTQYDADSYQKYRFSASENLQSVIFSYLEEKKVDPIRLAVDVGCGSGQSTRVLAARFEKVVGTDISEAQIEAAKQAASFPNVSYHVCPAEELPFEDGSVDLITAFTAAHWFDIPRFMKEVDRVLKPHGCVALSTYTTDFSMHYKDCSERLTEIFTETRDLLLKYADEKVNLVNAEYKEVFEAVPFPDKKRVTQILDKIPMSVSGVIGLFQSFSMYQAFLRSDPEAAKSLLQKTEQRFLETMGVCSNETQVEIGIRSVSVLACKGP